jgi:transcriptional regulator PpsR
VKAFKAPKDSLGDLDAEAAATLIATAADIALVVDGDGVIQDIAFQETNLSMELEGYGRWFGRPWADTVSPESQPKVDALLREAAAKTKSGWRQLNHRSSRGVDIPILYAAVQIEHSDRFVALGRDLRTVATLQQKLVEAQMSMERDYARLRHVETRYRLLFQMSSEPVLIVDAATQKVLEANPAAVKLFGGNAKRVVGRAFPDGFDTEGTHRVQALMADVRTSGRGDDARARLADGGTELLVSASLFRQDLTSMILVRLRPLRGEAVAMMPPSTSKLLQLVESTPDGLVVTDRDGRIVSANPAFIEMAQLASEDQAHGETLERWFGRPGIDLSILLANLRQNESVRLFATSLRGEYGATADIEASAVPLAGGDTANFGFAIRNVERRLSPTAGAGRELPRSVEQLTELIGRVPLKEIVRETTDVIERLCIEAALNLTGDNRASAAEMLGLSRQSLYVKLRRYGLADLPAETETEDQ